MKKNKFYLSFIMLITALMLASCCNDVPDYAKLIPKDAAIVIRVDVRQISKKSGFGDNDKLKKKIENVVKENMSGKVKEKVMAIIDDPAEAGLDLRDPVFIYITPEHSQGGIVGAVYKAEKFEELLNVFAKETGVDKVKKDGDQYYIDFGGVLVTFNDDWFHIGALNDGDAKQAAKALVKRFESEKNSIVDNEGFKKMCEKDGLAQLFIQGEWVYNNYEEIFGLGRTYYDYEELGPVEQYPYDEVESDSMKVESDSMEDLNPVEEYPYDEVESDSMDNDYDDYEPYRPYDEEPWTTDTPKNPFDGLKDMLGIDINNLAAIFDLNMDKGEASISVELAAVKEKGKKQMEDIDKMLGGKKEGFYFRFNFGFIDRLAKNLSGYEAKQASMVAKLLKFVELKYEGDCKLTLRVVTNDDDNTPLQTILEMVQKEFGL